MHHRRRQHLTRHGVWRRLADRHRRLHGDHGVGVSGKRRQRVVVEAGVAVGVNRGLVIPPTLENAHLADQRILERGVHGQEAVVIAVDDEIRVVGRLLRRSDVLRPLRRIFDGVVGAMEDPHQRRQDGLYGIAYVHADHLAAPVLFIAKRLAAIIFGRLRADRRDVVVDVVNRVVDLLADDALQLVVAHHVGVDFLLQLVD